MLKKLHLCLNLSAMLFALASTPATLHAADTSVKPVRVAIVGLVHDHAMGLFGPLAQNPNVQLVAIVETDPAVKSGMFEPEMRLWFGSAALSALTEIHEKITKKKL